jgi:hypothetical protein
VYIKWSCCLRMWGLFGKKRKHGFKSFFIKDHESNLPDIMLTLFDNGPPEIKGYTFQSANATRGDPVCLSNGNVCGMSWGAYDGDFMDFFLDRSTNHMFTTGKYLIEDNRMIVSLKYRTSYPWINVEFVFLKDQAYVNCEQGGIFQGIEQRLDLLLC